jgi:hypothetical protein
VCLGSDEGVEKRKKGRRVKRRGKGGGSGQGHAEKEEGGGVGIVDLHDTDATGPGCSNSGGRRMPRSAVGAGCEQGRRWARATHARAADRWGRAATGPDGRWRGAGGREEERGSGGVGSDRWV